MCNINHPKFPCRICAKNVHDKDKAVQCDLCELWIHNKCNKLNYLDYRYLQNCDESWYCIDCCSTIFPFNSLSSNKNFLAFCTNTDSNIIQWKDVENDHKYYDIEAMRNIIVGVIYRHRSMDLTDFNCNYLNKLLENISKEQKSVFPLGDFNVNLFNYNEPNQTNEFLDYLASNSFISLILQPTRITSHSNTLIDNIFSNVIDPDIISGNLTATISDHLPQFSIIPNMLSNISGNKSNIYERDWSKFDQENFILDYFSVDWEDLLKTDELNAGNSTRMYLDKINMLLDTYAPLKRINKYKMKFKPKPWIALGLQKSISVKNKLLKNFINKKDPVLKEEFHTNYKK